MEYDNDHVLCECDLAPLQRLVGALEQRHTVVIVKEPSVCLTMVRAEDSLDRQEFYLGEALTTECEVAVDGHTGHGVCLGDEPVRGYCLAVVDALMHAGVPVPPDIEAFLAAERERIASADAEEFDLVLRTQVDFKLMEQE
jgi:alpha-D-ribose 1-methylphosphonate 5-triphosphate synthase subunit PhnG